MKKILFHINSLGKGGAERVLSTLTDYLAEQGYDIVVATEWTAKEEYELNSKIKRIDVGVEHDHSGRFGKILHRYQNLRRCIQQERPHVIVSFMIKSNYRACLAALGMNIPVITSVRSNPANDYVGTANSIMNVLMEHKAAGCVFQTKGAMEFFPKAFQKKSTIILNPINEKYMDIKQCPIDQRSNRIVAAGRITEVKNQLLLLQAFYIIKDEFPETKVEIYGEDGHDGTWEQLISYIQEQKLEERVQLMGDSNQLEIDLTDAKVFTMTSMLEGLPNALMEAMVMGIPVVSTDCPSGGPRTLIQHGKNGLLCENQNAKDLADQIRYLLNNPQDAQEMAALAQEQMREQANTEVVCKQWENYIISI